MRSPHQLPDLTKIPDGRLNGRIVYDRVEHSLRLAPPTGAIHPLAIVLFIASDHDGESIRRVLANFWHAVWPLTEGAFDRVTYGLAWRFHRYESPMEYFGDDPPCKRCLMGQDLVEYADDEVCHALREDRKILDEGEMVAYFEEILNGTP